LLLAAAPLGAAPAGERIVPAERAVLERVLAESGIERVPVPPETSYVGEFLQAVQRAFLSLLLKGSQILGLPRWVFQAIAVALAGIAVFLLLRLVFSRRRRGPSPREEGLAEADLAPAAWGPAAWRAELERRLAEGRIAEALEALWWWLARSLAASRVEPDWTSRDLVTRAGREDLRDLARRLDAFTYGPRQPAVEDLRRLVGRLEEALA
jgi:hypothetical protein